MSNMIKSARHVEKVILLSGREMPIMGQGTWLMGEDPAMRQSELAALRTGLELGLNLIDTAEMYGEGSAEKLVSEVIKGRRDQVYLVSKVYPHNASLHDAVEACQRSLKRLGTDYLDLYLLHWKGTIPISETLEAFQLLKQSGRILDYGVSNFDIDDMIEAVGQPGGEEIVTNQVLYNLVHRGIEWDLLPWCRKNQIQIMAYSPIEHSPRDQRGLLDHPQLRQVAHEHNATTAQIAIAWLLYQEVVVIAKASNVKHVMENRAALDIKLNKEDLLKLDYIFPPPERKIPLEMR